MKQFIQRTQSIENTSYSDQSSEYAVKRCVHLSPSSLRLSKRSFTNMPSESSENPSDTSVHVDKPSKRIPPTRKQLFFSTLQAATVLMLKSTGDNCSKKTSSSDQPKRNTNSSSAEQPSFSTRGANVKIKRP